MTIVQWNILGSFIKVTSTTVIVQKLLFFAARNYHDVFSSFYRSEYLLLWLKHWQILRKSNFKSCFTSPFKKARLLSWEVFSRLWVSRGLCLAVSVTTSWSWLAELTDLCLCNVTKLVTPDFEPIFCSFCFPTKMSIYHRWNPKSEVGNQHCGWLAWPDIWSSRRLQDAMAVISAETSRRSFTSNGKQIRVFLFFVKHSAIETIQHRTFEHSRDLGSSLIVPVERSCLIAVHCQTFCALPHTNNLSAFATFRYNYIGYGHDYSYNWTERKESKWFIFAQKALKLAQENQPTAIKVLLCVVETTIESEFSFIPVIELKMKSCIF